MDPRYSQADARSMAAMGLHRRADDESPAAAMRVHVSTRSRSMRRRILHLDGLRGRLRQPRATSAAAARDPIARCAARGSRSFAAVSGGNAGGNRGVAS